MALATTSDEQVDWNPPEQVDWNPSPPTPAATPTQSVPSANDLANQNFDATNATLRRIAKVTAGSIVGGWAGIESVIDDLASGKAPDLDKASSAVQNIQDKFLQGDKATSP